jgi:hypothetical protein
MEIKVRSINKHSRVLLASVFLWMTWNVAYGGDEIKKEPNRFELDVSGLSYLSSKTNSPSLQKQLAAAKGWSKYIRFSKHDGNLVEAGFVNQGQLSDGYFSGGFWGMTWPKGSNRRSYGYTFVFFVAGETKDARGNTIHIVSDRYARSPGEISPDYSHAYYFMPVPRYFNNHHPNSTDWDMGGISEDVGMDGLPGTKDEGEGDGILQSNEDFNSNGILDLSMINESEWVAMSHRRETWPADWPPASYNGDTRGPDDIYSLGPCHGRWNGEYGYYVRSDQESYYVMDDHENDEFEYYPENLPGTDQPDMRPWPDGRRGLGITVKVRNYQWNARLAEDLLISIYDIYTTGKPINHAVVGMYADIDIGGVLDLANFDTADDITYVWDSSQIWRQKHLAPTGYFGFAFLESPGLDSDGKDNDEDGIIDESQYNNIDDDKDWRKWQDDNGNGVYDTEDVNHNRVLDAGEDLNNNGLIDYEPLGADVGSDGIGPDDDDYTGPDANGTEANGLPDSGEPNFDQTDNDESDQVGLTSWYLKSVNSRQINDEEFWWIELRPGTFEQEAGWEKDVSFTYGCGYVPLTPPRTDHIKRPFHRFSIACLFGTDQQDIFRNKRTMQKIYDSDYNFTKPPRKPFLQAFPGDGKVLLLWDNRAESSRDPIYGSDFEGYKIYKSTDPNFSDIKTITDAFNNPLLYTPVAQFDLKDNLYGPHPITLGREGGVQSDLGIAFDMGSDSGLRHFWVDTSVTNGRSYYYALVAYDRGYDQDFFSRGLAEKVNLLSISPTECSAIIQTDNLGRPIFIDQNCAAAIPMEAAAGYVAPSLVKGFEHVGGAGSGKIDFSIVTPYVIKSGHTYRLQFVDDGSLQTLNGDGEDIYTGQTSGLHFVDVTSNDTLFTPAGDYTSTGLGDKVINGFNLQIKNDPVTAIKEVKWIKGVSNLGIGMSSVGGKPVARDYEIRFGDVGFDSSLSTNRKTNFQVWDITDSAKPFRARYQLLTNFNDPDSLKNILSNGDNFWIFVKRSVKANGEVTFLQKGWRVFVELPTTLPAGTQQYVPQKGDIIRISMLKPFDRRDVFEFTMQGNEVVKQVMKKELADIYPVPNPYYAASSLERKVPVDVEGAGRGDRRIDFVNLPPECTITIYTVSGRLVREIYHNTSNQVGREMWDLRTKDGLEVASGYYFYHVQVPGIGGKSGKLAIIK